MCQDCEALPVALHPDSHALLKIRSNDTVIPSVLRDTYRRPSSPTNAIFDAPDSPVNPVPERSLESGFIHNPTSGTSPLEEPESRFSPISTPRSVSSLVLEETVPSNESVSHMTIRPVDVDTDVQPLIKGSQRPTLVIGETTVFDISSLEETSDAKPTNIDKFVELSTSSPMSTLTQTVATQLQHLLNNAAPKDDIPAPDSTETLALVSEAPLRATFISDVTVADGSIFPPGAEFIKCWKMTNSGERDWPETTQLVFTAGEGFGAANQSVSVGLVKSGETVDLWTKELKASFSASEISMVCLTTTLLGTRDGRSLHQLLEARERLPNFRERCLD